MNIQRSIKKALQNPAAVSGLDLRQLKPTTLLPEIALFTNLEYIDLSNCKDLDWADACKKLAALPLLTELKAFGADIAALPEEIGLLTSLKKLDLSSNPRLVGLPQSFTQLTNLEEINFYGCGLMALPQTVWHFKQLHTLTLSKNKLAFIIPTFFDDMPNLKNLFIADNGMEFLPEEIGYLKSLQVLYAGGNAFTVLPNAIKDLQELESLWLDSCPALDFEKELQKIQELPLKNLSILGNNISVLPAALKNIKTLQELNINSNLLPVTFQLIRDLSTLPLKKLDIRFMGDAIITLFGAKEIIPTLEQIDCDPRSSEQYMADIASWLTKDFSA